MKKIAIFSILTSFVVSGCAGQASLQKKVAFELGYDPSEVEITNISHGMYETTFNAKLAGVMHNCTAIGGNFMSFGQAVSPSCTPIKSSGVKGKKRGSCNAMLRAAKRC